MSASHAIHVTAATLTETQLAGYVSLAVLTVSDTDEQSYYLEPNSLFLL